MPQSTTKATLTSVNSNIDTYARNYNYYVKFTHLPTGHVVQFPSTLISFSDTHTPEFSKQYGNDTMDPTIILNSTDRRIDFSFTVLNSSIDDARHNTQCVNLLIQMLYPLLDVEGSIIGNPYVKIEMQNLLNSGDNTSGVTCIIENIEFSMNLEEGVINGNQGVQTLNYSRKELYPISLEISIGANSIMERGLNDNSNFLPTSYPSYGGR